MREVPKKSLEGVSKSWRREQWGWEQKWESSYE